MLTKDTVRSIATLARLNLTEEETEAFSTQLSSILGYFDEISEVNTAGAEPLVTPTEMNVVFREDQAQDVCPTETILKNAPEKSGNLYKVPPVV